MLSAIVAIMMMPALVLGGHVLMAHAQRERYRRDDARRCLWSSVEVWILRGASARMFGEWCDVQQRLWVQLETNEASYWPLQRYRWVIARSSLPAMR